MYSSRNPQVPFQKTVDSRFGSIVLKELIHIQLQLLSKQNRTAHDYQRDFTHTNISLLQQIEVYHSKGNHIFPTNIRAYFCCLLVCLLYAALRGVTQKSLILPLILRASMVLDLVKILITKFLSLTAVLNAIKALYSQFRL